MSLTIAKNKSTEQGAGRHCGVPNQSCVGLEPFSYEKTTRRSFVQINLCEKKRSPYLD